MSEKLHKVLARNGYGSRREMEGWIEAGRLSINGRTAKTADRVSDDDTINLDGNNIDLKFEAATQRVLIYNKPEGEICTRNDPEGRPDVFAKLPKLQGSRWIIVGRLDLNTSGLLLFTTDGDLANTLMHPSSEIVREYAVRVLGEVDGVILENLINGVELEDGRANFSSIEDVGGKGANHWYNVTLKEGRKREVRRLWESQGLRVSRLKRIGFGPLSLPARLKSGMFRDLDQSEMNLLYSAIGKQAPKVATQPKPKTGKRHSGPYRRKRK